MRFNGRRNLRETFGRGLAASAVAGAVVLAPLAAIPAAHASSSAACEPRSDRTVLSSTFDDETLGGLVQDGGPTFSYEHVDGDAGDKALLVHGRTADYDGVQTEEGKLAVAKGEVLTITARVRLADPGQAATEMRIVAVPGYSWIGNAAVTADGWTTIGGTYTVPEDADLTALKFYIGTGGGSAVYDYYVDDFTITGPPGDTVISADFEDGTTGGWVGRDDGNGPANLAVVDGGKESAKALSVTDRVSQGQGPLFDTTCLLLPDVTYQFDGDIRFAAGEPTDEIDLSIANQVGGADPAYTNALKFTDVSNSGWTHVSGTFTVPAGDSTQIYLETKWHSDHSLDNTADLLFDNLQVSVPSVQGIQDDLVAIKDTLPFPVGAAITKEQTTGYKAQLLDKHFDQVTPENFMKPEAWYDDEHHFVSVNDEADQLMTHAQQNGLRVYGHTLAWYQQTPDWFFQDDEGEFLTDSPADQAIMRQRLADHIDNVARYLSEKYGEFGSPTNPLVAFDVVNEAVSDNVGDADDLRQTHWYQILGKDYIADAFGDAEEAFNHTYAAEGADRPVKLFYNDYNTEQTGKRGRVLDLVERLIDEGVPVDGIGHQFHVTLSTPVSTLRAAIEAFQGISTTAGAELQQAVTELDVPTGTPVTEANKIDQGYYYKSVFDMLREEWADDPDIFSATVWGLTDGQSWRASSGAPLLFGDDLQAKYAYYGVTDQDLPAKQLSAIVFQQGAADLGDPAAVEWGALPLHAVGDHAGFQVRWALDHLTAYVDVQDATTGATDAATFTWGSGSTASVERDGTVTGTGVTAKVVSTTAGWKAVVALPAAGLAMDGTTKFDVSVTDGSATTGWNTPGELGTLQLKEPLSLTTIPEASAAPAIDGTKDAVWSQSSSVTPSKLIQGTANDTTATVRQLWKGQYLYLYAEVSDRTGAAEGGDSSSNAYERDSLEVFTDPGNAKNGSYRADDAQMRLGANGDISFGAGDTEAAQKARLISAAKRVPGGYVIEARIDLKEHTGVGTFQGLDYEVNDGADGARAANYGWAEQTGTAYQTTSRWGVGRLVAGTTGGQPGGGTTTPQQPAPHAPVVTHQPKKSVKVKAGKKFRVKVAASGSTSVTWQVWNKRKHRWVALKRAHRLTLTLRATRKLDGARYRAVLVGPGGTTVSRTVVVHVRR
jgi:endo-1,4-beta-xylanase